MFAKPNRAIEYHNYFRSHYLLKARIVATFELIQNYNMRDLAELVMSVLLHSSMTRRIYGFLICVSHCFAATKCGCLGLCSAWAT